MNLRPPRGMRDLFSADLAPLRRIEAAARRLAALHGYEEIRTPHLEPTELFARAIGETSDIVEKEMYSLSTAGGDKLTLRPEGTAGVVRAYLAAGLHKRQGLAKYFYLGEMFRHEAPQSKRWREFSQFGIEILGTSSPEADVETVLLAAELFRELGLGVATDLNSIGCAGCRPKYREALTGHLKEREGKLCGECRARIKRNVLRALDCRKPPCREATAAAPATTDHLCEECAAHFSRVRAGLDALGVSYDLNPRLVRGLDYYTRTVFEIFPAGEGERGQQDALGAGGRYDGLAELLGDTAVGAVGFALGLDRIALVMKNDEGAAGEKKERAGKVFIVAESDEARAEAMKLALELRRSGIVCETDLEERGMKGQFRKADRSGAARVVVLSGKLREQGLAGLKDLETGKQEDLPLGEISRKILGKA